MSFSEYMNLELKLGALKLVRDVLGVRSGESVLIYGDTSNDLRVMEATAEAAYSLGAEPVTIRYETRTRPGLEPPKPLSAAMCASDVIIEYTTSYILYTKAFWDAVNRGNVRYIILTGMDVDMMVRCISRVDYVKMVQLGERLVELTKNASKFRVTSPAGTDLQVAIDKEMVRHSGRIIKEPSIQWATMGGQASFAPIWGSANGTVVFDGCIWPPDEINVLREPVKLTVKDSLIVKIDGGAQATMFERWLRSLDDPHMFDLVHISYGFNPGVKRISGRILEDERVFGGIEMGIGSYRGRPAKGHTDGVMLNPSIWLDGNQIEDSGKYVEPTLVELSRQLGV
jgi:leucyl aminopeptidase (aminopeptidase T)